MLLIGSHALRHHINTLERKSLDIDFICTRQAFENLASFYKKSDLIKAIYPTSGKGMVIKLKDNILHPFPLIQEYSLAYEGSSEQDILDYVGEDCEVASMEVLLMLKMSHRYLKNSPHFLKTMRDIQLLRSHGVTLTPELEVILKKREKETYNYKLPSLAQGKESFFVKDESFYVYDHDDIHKAVARLDKPAYTYFKPDDSEVMVSKKLWNECSRAIKLHAGLEEAMVLALERSLIPAPGKLTPKQAFDMALMKVCTSITSGWFREFCWENYDSIQDLYCDSYVDDFQQALYRGEVKPFKR